MPFLLGRHDQREGFVLLGIPAIPLLGGPHVAVLFPLGMLPLLMFPLVLLLLRLHRSHGVYRRLFRCLEHAAAGPDMWR